MRLHIPSCLTDRFAFATRPLNTTLDLTIAVVSDIMNKTMYDAVTKK